MRQVLDGKLTAPALPRELPSTAYMEMHSRGKKSSLVGECYIDRNMKDEGWKWGRIHVQELVFSLTGFQANMSALPFPSACPESLELPNSASSVSLRAAEPTVMIDFDPYCL